MPGVDEYLTPPSDFSTTSKAVYRFWVYTSSDDRGGSKGSVSICLHGALGHVWVQDMQKMTVSKHGASSLFDTLKRCEIYVESQDVGTVHKLTISYASGKDEGKSAPWKLSQVLVRHGSDGVVTVFPAAAAELKPPDAPLLALMPRMSWHEDLFGNVSEAAPPPPPTGQWHWPASARFDVLMRQGPHDDHARASEHEALQLKLYDAILHEELLPLVDEAVHDVAMSRTPGSFVHGCAQCVAGTLLGSEASLGTMEALRKYVLRHVTPSHASVLTRCILCPQVQRAAAEAG